MSCCGKSIKKDKKVSKRIKSIKKDEKTCFWMSYFSPPSHYLLLKLFLKFQVMIGNKMELLSRHLIVLKVVIEITTFVGNFVFASWLYLPECNCSISV